MAEKKQWELKPWERAINVNGLSPEKVTEKMRNLGEEAKPLREDVPAHGSGLAGTQLQRSTRIRTGRTGIK